MSLGHGSLWLSPFDYKGLFLLLTFQLWGVIKQGYRCKDCGMNCHKQCKDLVVFECKRRFKATAVDNSPASALASSLCPMGLKEHMHGLEEGGFPFPNGDVLEHSEESKDRTIMVMGELPQKISVRLKPAVQHKGTQTDLALSHDDGLPRQQRESATPPENTFLHPTPLSPCPSPVLSRKKAYVKWENKDFSQNAKEEPSTIRPSYQELEQERNILTAENEALKLRLKQAHKKIELLSIRRNHILDNREHGDCL